MIDPFSRRTSVVYDGSNKIRRVQDPAGRITSFTVNASGDLTRTIKPDGTITSKGYWRSPGGKTPHATLYTAVTMLPKAC